MVHGAVHSLLRVFLTGVTIVVALTALLAWRLSEGPVSMNVLVPYIADGLSPGDGSIVFEIGSAELSWMGLTSSPQVKALDVTAIDQRGSKIASFSEMTVGFSLKSILDGIPSPNSVILDHLILTLTRLDNGEVIVGSTQTSVGEDSHTPLLSEIIPALMTPGSTENRAGYLENIGVQDAMITFFDQASQTEWVVQKGTVSLGRNESEGEIDATLPIRFGKYSSLVTAKGIFTPKNQTISAVFDFSDVRPSVFADLSPELKILEGADIEVGGTFEASVSLDNAVAVETTKVSVEATAGNLLLPNPIDKTYAIEKFSLQARTSNRFKNFSVEQLVIELQEDGPHVDLRLEGEDLLGSPSASASLSIDEVSMAELKALWPADLKPNTNRWITQNLNGGKISDATFELSLSGPDIASVDITDLDGRGDLSGIAVSYIRGMPPVLDTHGVATFSPSEVVIDVTGGRVEQDNAVGALTIEAARVRLHGLNSKPQSADIDIRVDGNLRDAITLIDNEPLRYATALGIQPAATSGFAEVLLSIDFPLIKDLKLGEVQVSANASLQQASIKNAGLGLDLDAGQFSLTIDNAGMDVAGTASLGGIRTGLAWRENFSGETFKRQYALDAVLENGQRSMIGLGHPVFAPPYVDGPIRLEALYTVSQDAENNLFVEADLRDASLKVRELNWQKDPGVEALFSSEMTIVDNRLNAMPRFDLRASDGSLQVSGNLDFGDSSTIKSASIANARVGSSTFDLKASTAEDGVLDILMTGEILDGRTFWSSLRTNNRTRSFRQDEVTGDRMPFRFKGDLARVLLSGAGELRDVDAVIEQTPTGLSQIKVNSRVTETDTFTLAMQENDGTRRFEAQSGNGGSVLKALGLGDDFVGGDFLVSGLVDETGAVNGSLSIDTFKLVDAPLLARLLSVASLTGIVDELQGTGISFSKINVPFNYSDQVFAIDGGAMYGPSLGLTAAGKYDLARRTLDGSGTIVPAYAVNSALGSIPIVGPIFTGGEEDGGLFAATYTMRGNPEGGEITVNPLATLTPGFLRQIFRVFDPPPATSDEIQNASPTSN